MILIIFFIIAVCYLIYTHDQDSDGTPREKAEKYWKNVTYYSTYGPEPDTKGTYISGKDAAKMVNATMSGKLSWDEKMKLKYPVYGLPNGRAEVRHIDSFGEVYTCPCSPRPTAEEYYLIAQRIADKKRKGESERAIACRKLDGKCGIMG